MRYWYCDKNWWYIGFRYDPELVESVKKFPGSGYNPQNKEWHVPISLPLISTMRVWLTENGFKEGMNYIPSKRVIEFIEPPTIITPEDVLEACEEIGLTRKPRYYQAQGISYMMNYGNCINGDDCGLGKTGEQIVTIELMDLFPALILCPASVKHNWKKEWLKWNPDRKIGIVEPMHKKKDENVWNNDVVIINYDLLSERSKKKPISKFKQLVNKNWACCAIDEIHFLKSPKAIRTKVTNKIVKRIPHIWGLTGTLIQIKPADLIEPYKIIRKFDEIFGEDKDFKYRYCNAKYTAYGFEYNGISNLEELHQLLKMGGYIRRNKRDVLTELPDFIEQTIDVPITNKKEYHQAENNLVQYLEKIDLNKANNAVNAPHLVMINTLKLLSIAGKMKFIQIFLKEWLESNEDESVVVFGVHREPLQTLAKYFNAPLIQGGVSSAMKHQIVNEFSQKKYRILFANIQSAGTGVDGLQENCSNIIYIELPVKSTDLEQTKSRLERMGQKNIINCTYLLSPDTIDMSIMEMVKDKEMITGVINKGASENELLARKFLLKHFGK